MFYEIKVNFTEKKQFLQVTFLILMVLINESLIIVTHKPVVK